MRELVKYFSLFLLLAALQVYVLDNIYLFSLAHPLIYFYGLVVLPKIPKWILLLVGFGLGVFFDSFYYTPGVNSAACVLIAYLKEPLLMYLKSAEENDTVKPHLHFMGISSFLSYAFIMSLMFHLVSSFLAIFSLNEIFFTLTRVVVNSIISVLLMLTLDILFFYRKAEK